MDEAAHDHDTADTVGGELRAARMAQGLGLPDVAARTRVPARHLAAIEEGHYTSLPAATYSTGFVRTYARLLGLDGGLLSQRFRAELARREPEHVHRQEPYEPADPARVPSRGLALGALVLAVLLALGYLYWRGSRLENATDVATITAAPKDRVAPAGAGAPPAMGTSVPQAASAIGGPVLLTALQPAWVRITDAGATLFQGVLNSGDHFQVPAGAIDPRLRTSRVTALKVTVGDTIVPPLGPPETLVKDISLKADALLARASASGSAAPRPQ